MKTYMLLAALALSACANVRTVSLHAVEGPTTGDGVSVAPGVLGIDHSRDLPGAKHAFTVEGGKRVELESTEPPDTLGHGIALALISTVAISYGVATFKESPTASSALVISGAALYPLAMQSALFGWHPKEDP